MIYWLVTLLVLGPSPFPPFLLYLFLIKLSKRSKLPAKDTTVLLCSEGSNEWNREACVCVFTIRKYMHRKYGFVGIVKWRCDCIYLCSIFSCQDPATYCQDRHTCTWGNGERSEVLEDTSSHSLHLAGGWAHRSLELFKDGRKDKLCF